MKQHEAVIQALENLGGAATLGQLNAEVFKIDDCEWKTKTKFASVRRIVQTRNEIYKIQRGLYGLVKYKKQLKDSGVVEITEKNQDSKEVKEFTHGHYQGMLLTIGKLKGYGTYMPNQDKNRRFGSQKLVEVRTLQDFPKFGYDMFVKRSSTIDTIWFNERKMPNSFFEVEHSTDIQNSLLKFVDLLDFNAKMYIVADASRKKSFLDKLDFAAFKCFGGEKGRVHFLSYELVEKWYEQAIQENLILESL